MPRRQCAEPGSCGNGNRYALNTNELKISSRIALNFEAKFDRLPNSANRFVK